MNKMPQLYFIWATLFILLLTLTACAGPTIEGARFRIARLAGNPGPPLPVDRSEFTSLKLEDLKKAEVKGAGSRLLLDKMLVDKTIAAFVEARGVPDAVLLRFSSAVQVQWFSVFYKEPSETVVFKRTLADINWLSISELEESRKFKELDTIPRTVVRLAFGSGPLPPPWPVTIQKELYKAFGVPELPGPPPLNQEEPGDVLKKFQEQAASLRNTLKELPPEKEGRIRAEKTFKRAVEGVTIPGVSWSLYVFEATEPVAFGAPDGTVFLSSGLVSSLTDDEITAVAAHIVGHEEYRHSKNLMKKARLMGLLLLVNSVASITQYGHPGATGAPAVIFLSGGYTEVLTNPALGYNEEEEVEADRTAADILKRLGIPPDTLFDAFSKFSQRKRVERSLGIENVHHLDRTTYDFGVMLDSGEIK